MTALADVGRYSKPQPSLMPDLDSTLRNIAQWNIYYCILPNSTLKIFFEILWSQYSLSRSKDLHPLCHANARLRNGH